MQMLCRLTQGVGIPIPETDPSTRSDEPGSDRQTNSCRPSRNDRTTAKQIQLVNVFSCASSC